MKYGFDEDTLEEQTYDTDGWPVIIIDESQTVDGDNIILYLQFVTDNNDNKVFYGQVAQVTNAQGNNFSGPDDLQLPPTTMATLLILQKLCSYRTRGPVRTGRRVL